MSTLGVAIGTADTVISVPGGLTVGSFPAPFTIDSEYILVTGGGSGSQFYSVERGQNGSARAAHVLNAALTAGWSAAGVTPTLAQVLAAGADGGGLKITGLADPVADQDAATKDYVDDAIPATPTLAAVLAAGALTGGSDIEGAQIGAQNPPSLSLNGNSANLLAGDNNAGGAGGDAILSGGSGNGTNGNGAFVRTKGSAADDTGGSVQLVPGAAGTVSGKAGGDVVSTLPAGDGAGRHGQFIVLNLPTADPHVVGAFYSVAGTLHISAG